jgi:hypothetical protein
MCDIELDPLRCALAQQTYRDFELVTSTKGTRSEGWNDAISKARGEFFVFTESDALPLNRNWLEELSRLGKKGHVLKAIEIRPFGLNMSNLICDAEIFATQKFDQGFRSSEDTEMFARLTSLGIPIQIADVAPVVHASSGTRRKTLTRAIKDGMAYALIAYKYGTRNLESVSTEYRAPHRISPIGNRLWIISENLLILAGLALGAIVYLPVLVANRRQRSR